MALLAAGTFPPFFANYIHLVEADTIAGAIEEYSEKIIHFFEEIPTEKVDYRYADGKWTVKELLQHVIDAERIFAYRALRISRHDPTPLPGFDEGLYVSASNASARSWESILEEFKAVRKSTDLLLESFTPDHLKQSGITNDHPNTTLAVSFVIFGHILHHIIIITERYL